MNLTDIRLLRTEEGLAFFGDSEVMEEIRAEVFDQAVRLTPVALQAMSRMLENTPMEDSDLVDGLWVRIADMSVEKMLENGIEIPEAGVLRGLNGSILHHIKFDDAKFVKLGKRRIVALSGNPYAMGLMAVQVSIERAVAELKDYLVRIERKVDYLVRYNEICDRATLDSMVATVDHAEYLLAQTGYVDSITWSKLHSAAREADAMHLKAVASLHDLAENVEKTKLGSYQSIEALRRANAQGQQWLGILAYSLLLHNRVERLELAHRATERPDTLEITHETFKQANADREAEIVALLDRLVSAAVDKSTFNHFRRLTNLVDAPKIVNLSNKIIGLVYDFAETAALQVNRSDELNDEGFIAALKGTAEDIRIAANNRREAINNSIERRQRSRLAQRRVRLQRELESLDEKLTADRELGAPRAQLPDGN